MGALGTIPRFNWVQLCSGPSASQGKSKRHQASSRRNKQHNALIELGAGELGKHYTTQAVCVAVGVLNA